MKKLPFVIFLAFMASAMVIGIGSYKATERCIRQDVQQALAMTLQELACDRVDVDTIRCYRRHITITEVRDTACIEVRMMASGQAELVAGHGCGFVDILMMSDQRAASSLLAAGLLWMAGSIWYMRRRGVATVGCGGVMYGGLLYDAINARFVTADGEPVRLTPMQQQLMEMFFNTDDHTLSKQEICDRLWPKKPDASETLYTLIRRLKPVIERSSRLRIESERGKAYRLVD